MEFKTWASVRHPPSPLSSSTVVIGYCYLKYRPHKICNTNTGNKWVWFLLDWTGHPHCSYYHPDNLPPPPKDSTPCFWVMWRTFVCRSLWNPNSGSWRSPIDGSLWLRLDYIRISDVSELDGFIAYSLSLFCHQQQAHWVWIFTQSKLWGFSVKYKNHEASTYGLCPIQRILGGFLF